MNDEEVSSQTACTEGENDVVPNDEDENGRKKDEYEQPKMSLSLRFGQYGALTTHF
jgi:hypothetical protein